MEAVSQVSQEAKKEPLAVQLRQVPQWLMMLVGGLAGLCTMKWFSSWMSSKYYNQVSLVRLNTAV